MRSDRNEMQENALERRQNETQRVIREDWEKEEVEYTSGLLYVNRRQFHRLRLRRLRL